MANNFKNFSEHVFSPDFSLNGAHLVEASAGTGKTYNIQNIYARLIMEKGLLVSQIQVMTFTEAATKELRDRLRTILKDVQARFNGKDCDDKNEEATKHRNERADNLIHCAEKIPNAKQRIELALLMFDNAAISTIHGFCSRALSKFAFETRMGFSTEIKDNKIEELTQRTMDWWQSERLKAPEDIRDNITLDRLLNFVKTLSGKTDWQLKYPQIEDTEDNEDPDSQGIKQKIKADTYLLAIANQINNKYESDRCNRTTQTYDDLLRSMREALNGEYGKEFAQRLREEFKAALIDEFQDTDPIQYDIFSKAFLCDKNFPVFFVGDPKQAIYSFRGGDIFTYRKATQQDVPETEKYYLATNFRSTPRLMKAINALFHDQEGKLTFEDETITYKNDIQATAKKGLPVDINGEAVEDPAPFKIVDLTIQNNDKNNEKDKADSDCFEVMARIIAQTLNDYRDTISPKDIAVLVNRHDEEQSSYNCLKAHGVPCVMTQAGNVFSGEVEHKYNKSGDNTKSAAPAATAREFYLILQAMGETCNKIQVRTALATSFFGYTPTMLSNIPDEEIAEWIGKFRSLNQCWLQRGFAAAISAFEDATVIDGIGFQERIAVMPDGERWLTDYHQIVELALAVSQTQGTSPEIILNWLDGRLNGNNLIAEQDTDAYSRELESESNAVQIMTMHVSKGLQFPLVFLPNADLTIRNQDPSIYHDPEQNNALTCDITANHSLYRKEEKQEKIRQIYVAMTRAIQRTVVFIKPKNKKKNGNESNEGNEGILKPLIDRARQYENQDSPFEWIDVNKLPPADIKYVQNKKQLELVDEPSQPRPYSHRPVKGSYCSLSPSLKVKDYDEKDRDQDDSDQEEIAADIAPIFHIPGGAKIGSCWHEILEKISFQADDETIAELSANTLKNYGFNPYSPVADGLPTFKEITVDLIHKTLNYPLTATDGSSYALKDVTDDLRLSELEFNLSSSDSAETTKELAEIIRKYWKDDASKRPFLDAIENWDRQIPKGYLNGFIDLIYQHNGVATIVDWKSNAFHGKIEAFNSNGITNEMASHGYFFQYLLYAAVLQKYLKEIMGDKYSWAKHFGGIRYVFLRGIAADGAAPVYSDRPCEAMLDELANKLSYCIR